LHNAAVGGVPADECLLHHVLRIGDRAEHAVGDPHEHGALRGETPRSVVGLPGLRHQAACAAAAFAAAGSTHSPKPTASLFQPLMTLIIRVSFTCSSALKWVCSASRAAWCSCPSQRRVNASVQASAARSRSV